MPVLLLDCHLPTQYTTHTITLQQWTNNKTNKSYKQLIYIYISHVNVTQTVPDISPLMPMHQDPLLVSYIEINKAVSQWLVTFNLCVSVTWPLTCAFHIPCTHTPEIIDMHRGVCDNIHSWQKRLLHPGMMCLFCDYFYFISPRGLRTGCLVYYNVFYVFDALFFILLCFVSFDDIW